MSQVVVHESSNDALTTDDELDQMEQKEAVLIAGNRVAYSKNKTDSRFNKVLRILMAKRRGQSQIDKIRDA